MDRFIEAINFCGFCDLGLIGPKFTWLYQKSDGGQIRERLDKALAMPIGWSYSLMRSCNTLPCWHRIIHHWPFALCQNRGRRSWRKSLGLSWCCLRTNTARRLSRKLVKKVRSLHLNVCRIAAWINAGLRWMHGTRLNLDMWAGRYLSCRIG